ncbi:integrase arm-type DNA-binding domain-containing protein [Luminiphilus sp.]|nr:integrase arm-type DNA-binding domain-containing protein [Luminiphilus sp.]
MSLTNIYIKNAKPGDKSYRRYDEKGLYLEVTPAGGKLWRLKYRFGGKEKRLAIGAYPEVGLKAAREARDSARSLRASGIDPGEHKKLQKAAQTKHTDGAFETLAREWHAGKSRVWSTIHSKNVLDRLTRNVFPYVGNAPIEDITVPELLKLLRRIEERGAHETAHRVLGNIGEVYRYAIASGKAERNIALDIKGALQSVKKQHLAAVTEPKRVGELLKMMDAYSGTLTVQCALKLAPLVFVRPGELRQARWEDIDFETAEWRYTVTKTQTEHIVPLSVQAVEILKELHPVTGRWEYVFPNARSRRRPMSNNAILSALRRMEIDKDEMSGHGFRAMARTILDEVLGYRVDIIEHQLAHRVKDPLGRAYNRTSHLAERKDMMQAWADYLDLLRDGSKSNAEVGSRFTQRRTKSNNFEAS